MQSVFFFIESLDHGGAETMIANIARMHDPAAFEMHVLSETDGEVHTPTVQQYSRYKSIARKEGGLPMLRRVRNSLRMRIAMRASPETAHRVFVRGKYDIEVAFCEGFATKFVSGCTRKQTKKIAWVHTDVLHYPWSERVHGGSEAEKRCYGSFDAIVTVSETMRSAFIEKYGMADKVRVLYNPIDFDAIREKSRAPLPVPRPDGFTFVLVGSLKPVKGYDRLFRVCRRLLDAGYAFHVQIFGSGSEREKLEADVRELSLSECVRMTPYTDNPYPFVASADAFVCASRAEGYSTTVTEAVVLGVPVVTTDCSGMCEIFGERECGIICENSEDGQFEARRQALDSPALLAHFREEEAVRALDFDCGARMRAIEDFFRETAQS